ncbi:MAG: hypothetical protein H7834_06535 [Magnetococcus sp. YQC-9]
MSWLTTFLRERFRDPESLRVAGERACGLARPQAARAMMDEILELTE